MGCACSCCCPAPKPERADDSDMLVDDRLTPLPSYDTPQGSPRNSPTDGIKEAIPVPPPGSLSMTADRPMIMLPYPELESVNRTFQLSEQTYLDLLKRSRTFRGCLVDFKQQFGRGRLYTIADCLQLLGHRCEGVEITAVRGDNSLQLVFDEEEVEGLRQAPQEYGLREATPTLQLLHLYNDLTTKAKEFLDSGPEQIQLLQELCDNEADIRDTIMQSGLSSFFTTQALIDAELNWKTMRDLPNNARHLVYLVGVDLQEIVKETEKRILKRSES